MRTVAFGMLRAGTLGYLLKKEALERIVEAVRVGAGGEQWYSQGVMAKVAAWARGETPLSSRVAGLTGREMEVLRLLARGWTNKRIARELGIAERTVRFHLENLFVRLEVDNRVEAVVKAIRLGWLSVSE